MLPIIQIGPIALPVPQLSVLIAFWVGFSLSEKFSPKCNISHNALNNLVFTGLISGIIGARLGYIIQFPDAFKQSPLSILSTNPGLFDLFSGFAVAFLSMVIYGQRVKLPFWRTVDALTPLLAMLAVGQAVAHIGSGEAFGSETNLPWGINLWGARRHPSQLYELAGAIVIFGILGMRSKSIFAPGTFFMIFIILTAGSRLFLEAFRGDSSILWGGLRSGQIIAWLILAAALTGLEILKKQRQTYG